MLRQLVEYLGTWHNNPSIKTREIFSRTNLAANADEGGSGPTGMCRKGKMDKNPIQKIRQALYERLSNFDLDESQLRDKSLFQLVTLVHCVAGHLNYLGTYTCTCRTFQELFGDQFWHREEKPENVVTEEHEPKPKVVVN